MQLTSIPRGQVTAGSACLLAAVPEEWIASFPEQHPLTRNLTGNITLHEGRTWLRMVLTSRKRTLRHTSQRQPAGLIWPTSIAGTTVGTSTYLHHQLSLHAYHRWVLLYTEAGTNITYVVGRPGAGAVLNTEYNNTQATQHSISYTHTAVEPLPVYQGTYTLDNSVTITPTGAALQTIFYHATGTEANDGTYINLPQLAGRTVYYVSRSGTIDMEIVNTTPTTQNQILLDNINGGLQVAADFPISENETFFILYQ